jgi:hypothetical protein
MLGIVNAFFHTSAHTALQIIVPDEVRGRVMANYSLIWSLSTVGGTLIGAMAEVLGVQSAVAIGGGVVVIATIACWLRTPSLRTLD